MHNPQFKFVNQDHRVKVTQAIIACLYIVFADGPPSTERQSCCCYNYYYLHYYGIIILDSTDR